MDVQAGLSVVAPGLVLAARRPVPSSPSGVCRVCYRAAVIQCNTMPAHIRRYTVLDYIMRKIELGNIPC